jgi:periplasmic protein TonB
MKTLLCLLTLISVTITFAESGNVSDVSSQVYAITEVDHAPELMVKARLVYPPELKEQRVTGEVVIECVVDSDGSVRDPIVKSSSRKEFELPALQSVGKWKYKPARKAKKRVNVRQEITVTFEPKK